MDTTASGGAAKAVIFCRSRGRCEMDPEILQQTQALVQQLLRRLQRPISCVSGAPHTDF